MQSQKQKILWVDDEFANDVHGLRAYVYALERGGEFEIVKIAHPDKALEMLEKRTENFACIILDMALPYGERISREESESGNATGIVLEEKIKAIDKYEDIQIVVMMTLTFRQNQRVEDYCKENIQRCFFKAEESAKNFSETIRDIIKKEAKKNQNEG